MAPAETGHAPLEDTMIEATLLPPGLHDIDHADLDNHFLSAFPGSATRPQLIGGLRTFIAALQRIGIPFEIWIDGSFTTTKENPNDVDLVAFASDAAIQALDSGRRRALEGLFDRASSRRTFGCDVLFCVAEDANMRSYWRGWYGFDRDERPKGIARLAVTP